MHLGNKMLQHFLGDLEIGDHAVFQRPDSGDVTGRTTQHSLRFHAHRFDGFLTIMDADGNHRGLIQYDALIANVNQCIGSTKVDRKVIREHAPN